MLRLVVCPLIMRFNLGGQDSQNWFDFRMAISDRRTCSFSSTCGLFCSVPVIKQIMNGTFVSLL